MMKKIIVIILLIILIPYIIVSTIKPDDEIKFNYVSNKVVRVKLEDKNEIITVPFEEYVKGVLAGEMPIGFDTEALKAQAVAARSYVLKKMKLNVAEDYDVVNTVSNQVYLSDEDLKEKWQDKYVEYMNKLKSVIKDTKGEYLTYNGEVVEAFFFSTSAGKTENSGEVFVEQLPYLISVDSSWDESFSPVNNDTAQYSIADFCSKIKIQYSDNI